jgi:hypothetical protein
MRLWELIEHALEDPARSDDDRQPPSSANGGTGGEVLFTGRVQDRGRAHRDRRREALAPGRHADPSDPRAAAAPVPVQPVVELGSPGNRALLLVAIFVADRIGSDHRSAIVRAISFGLVFVLVAAAAFITGRLVVDLVEGGPETNSAKDLLSVGFGVWLYTILAFAFLYWLLDGGGPEARIWDPAEYPHLAFPEQLNP